MINPTFDISKVGVLSETDGKGPPNRYFGCLSTQTLPLPPSYLPKRESNLLIMTTSLDCSFISLKKPLISFVTEGSIWLPTTIIHIESTIASPRYYLIRAAASLHRINPR